MMAEQILLSPLRLTAFIQFLHFAKKAPQTIKNKMHHIVSAIRLLKTRKELDLHLFLLRKVKHIANAEARNCGKAIPARTALKADEYQMINEGKFFYEEEKSIFLQWLLVGM